MKGAAHKAMGRRHIGVYSLAVLVLSAIISAIAYTVLDAAVARSVIRDTERASLQWSAYLTRRITDLEGLAGTAQPTPEQARIIEGITRFGDVIEMRLFDRDGRLRHVFGEGPPTPQALGQPDSKALATLASASSQIAMLDHAQDPGSARHLVETYLPLTDSSGATYGVVQFRMDATSIRDVMRDNFRFVTLVLPLLCALVCLLPSSALIIQLDRMRRQRAKVDYLSRFDALTQTLNRTALTQEIDWLFRHHPNRASGIGLLFIDIDNFKQLNDNCGHEFGDAFLQHVSRCLSANLREDDLVGRMGGDEFIVVMPDIALEEMTDCCTRILHAVRVPFSHQGTTTNGKINVGAHISLDDETVAEAFHAAEMALYHAKATGRDKLVYYEPNLDKAQQRRKQLESLLQMAIDDGRFELVFQPLTRAQDGSTLGFETLLRLSDEEGTKLSPDEFIPVAEDTGLIIDLGIAVMHRAIETALTWPETVYLSVNLSAVQFRRGDLPEQVAALLKKLDFPAQRLELEVTESLLLTDEELVAVQLTALKQLGVSIAMDDFGTGYSSLGYLWKYSFDKLKIDRIFLEGYDFDPKRYRDIIETIVVLGHKMGMQVTIEGVETLKQVEMLRPLGCDQYQGYLFGKPMSADEAQLLVSKLPQQNVVA